MTTNFYNKVAKKFGNYHTDAKYIKEYPNSDPEKVFKEKLLELSSKDKTALDVGCADGRFTLSVAPYFQRIVAIDLSKGMLEAARKLQKEKAVENVSFEEQDASKTTYASGTFDVVYSRRGPTPFSESHRLLKSGGYFVGINIGERDCREIKEIFGRGQGFGQWDTSRLEKDKQELKDTGFEIVFAQDYFYDEYYASYEDLDLFLQGVPIFEDFDSEKDKRFLEEYVAKFKTEKGIRFPRHRVVVVAKKSKKFMKFLPLLPELYVTDFNRSLHFYVNILGFKLEYQRDNPKFGFFSYQGSQLMIQELGPGEKEAEKMEQPFGRGINFQIETDNIQVIIDSLNKHNYSLKRGIKDSWYRENNVLHGCREILITDPDGYLLRFSKDIGERSI